eukprot:10367354-Alexandrium_andersonii.AAC.1
MSMDPMDYRLLSIASFVNRRWAAMRLRDVQPWMDEWALPEMVGIKGALAPDAASWKTSLDIECAGAAGEVYCGMSADI